MIGGSPVAEEPAAVGRLEREVHLEPSPVRAARVGPASLVAVDAEPAAEPRRMLRMPPRPVRAVPPVPCEPPQAGERGRRGRASGERPRFALARRRRAPAHDREPVACGCAIPTDVAPPSPCRPQLPARRPLRRGGRGAGRGCGRGSRARLVVVRAGGGRCRSGHACEREQQPAGEDRAPQNVDLPGSIASRRPSGREEAPWAGTARRGLCDRSDEGSGRSHVCAFC
jgi:hypothetical protein